MKPVLLCCWLLALTGDAWAHRLDEYLQATRVAVTTNRIDLTMELTPGMAVVEQLLAGVDTNRDGAISDTESSAYAQRVLKDLRMALNAKALSLNLVDAVFPTLLEARAGVGDIRIKASVPVEPMAAGPHTLTLTNAHLPAISVYQVNALVPKDRRITITKQARDELQKTYRLEFEVRAATPRP